MSHVKWLVDDRSFPEDTNPLYKALNELGVEYKKIEGSLSLLEDIPIENIYPANDCVVFYGCLDVAKYLKKNAKWIPGVYYNIDKYNCTSYYPVFGKYLLNSNYIMLPFGELSRQKEYLYEKVGEDRSIFIRPNMGDKIFTGQVVYKEYFDKDIKLMGFYDIDPSELVVVAEPYNLKAEFRFVIVKNKVVTGSLYKENNIVGSEATYTTEAYELASKLATMYSPDRVWVIDICLTKGGSYKLLEIGCFSCAGMYMCNRTKIVESVSAAAKEEWDEYNSVL